MDFQKVVNDLNADIKGEFGDKTAEQGFIYQYITDISGKYITFAGHMILDVNKNTIDNVFELEDYLEDKVAEIGLQFLTYSFHKCLIHDLFDQEIKNN